MKSIRNIGERIEKGLASQKVKKYAYKLVQKEKHELTAENGQFNLLRTLFDNNAMISAFKSGKNGIVTGNDFSDSGINALVSSAVLSAESSVKDSCHDISPEQKPAKFRQGCLKPDYDKFFDKVKELISDIGREYPKVQIMSVIGEYDKVHSLYRNSNGVDFEEYSGSYSVMVEFSGHEGDKTTNLDYAWVSMNDLDKRFIDQGAFRQHLENAQNQLNQIPLTGKFEGSVIFTPDCFAQFMMYVQSNYISDAVLIDGTSLWKNKKGKRVADKSFSVSLNSHDPRMVGGERVTADGYKSVDLPVIEDGILKNFTIGLYAAKKTGKPVTLNSSSNIVIKEGTDSLDDLVKKAGRGLIVGGFSGGQPGTNGEFSGVAKNSYYIEDGKIKGAVSEVMINGNLGAMLMNIKGISKEVVVDGNMVIPYICVDGIVVSGK